VFTMPAAGTITKHSELKDVSTPHIDADLSDLITAEKSKAATFVVDVNGEGDYTDIQDAIDALPAEGGTIFVKEGTYEKPTPLQVPNSCNLIGANSWQCIIKNTGTGNVIEIIGTPTSRKHDILICNFFIHGNNTAQHGIYAQYITGRVRFSNLHIRYCTQDGIQIDDAYRILIDDCWVGYNGAMNIRLINVANACCLLNVRSENAGVDGLKCDTSHGLLILGGCFEANTRYGIWLQNSNHPRVYGAWLEGNGSRGMIVNDCNGASIRDCNFSNNGAYGLSIGGVTGSNRTVIEGDFFKLHTTASIIIGSAADYTALGPNYSEDVTPLSDASGNTDTYGGGIRGF